MPAPRWLKIGGQGARWCGALAGSFALWALWLVLALVLAAQTYIVSTSELQVPRFVLRALEERLAASGVRATFGRTSFDPSGRILVENARLTLPAYAEPVVAARAVYVQLDPWALAVGRFEPRLLRVTGASWSVPAMLSPSGRTEEILRDLDATLVPRERELELEQFAARIAGVAVTMHGTVRLPGTRHTAEQPLPVADFLANNYPALCRQIAGIADQLAALEAPALHLELLPSDTRGAIASATLLADRYALETPVPFDAKGLRIVTRFPLLGDEPVPARLELDTDELALPFEATAHRVRAVVLGTLQPARLRYEPREFQLTANSVAAAGYTASPVAARLTPGPLPRIDADITGALFGEPLAVHAETDFKAQTALVTFAGHLSSEIFGPLARRTGTDIRRFFNFESLACRDGVVHFGPAWKFQDVSVRADLRRIDAAHVLMEEGHAVVLYDGHRFYSPEAYARIGDNFARGTYEQDVKTRDYRFLLEGQLRPLAISGWWPSGWWERFFRQFDFPVAAPVASVDVRGRWGDGRESAVFIAVGINAPVIRGAKFDDARALLYVRPFYYDGMELRATRDTRSVRGTFNYTLEPATGALRQFDFDATSTLDLAVPAQIIGPASAAMLAPFTFAQPPNLKLAGRLTGATAPGGAHQSLRLAADSDGEFRFHDFPLQPVAFAATLQDDALTIDRLEAGFAGGTVAGRAKVWGPGNERRASFDLALKGASLGRASALLQEYSARQKNAPAPPPGKFVQEKAGVHIDANVAAEGRYNDPFSYQGAGTATLQGAELGEVNMLGALSELLKFTALRFNAAKAAFKVDGRKLAFSDVTLTGANSRIEAIGDFALDRRDLDFKAKVYPLHESGNFFKKLIELGLSPLTTFLEVRLNGTLDKPTWAFALSSGNPLRAPAPGEPVNPAEKPATPTPPPPTPKP